MNLNTPSIESGPITAADLDRKTNTGRIYHLPSATPAATAYGDDDMKPDPKVIPCRPLSPFARLALALRNWLRG